MNPSLFLKMENTCFFSTVTPFSVSFSVTFDENA